MVVEADLNPYNETQLAEFNSFVTTLESMPSKSVRFLQIVHILYINIYYIYIIYIYTYHRVICIMNEK